MKEKEEREKRSKRSKERVSEKESKAKKVVREKKKVINSKGDRHTWMLTIKVLCMKCYDKRKEGIAAEGNE